jgi:hypothetical protein
LKHVSRSLWGNVVAYIATTNDPEVGPRYLSTISDDLAKAIKLALERFIELGKIRSIDAQQFAFVLTRLERNHFLGYIYMKTMVLDDLLAGVTADVKLVMDTITV